MKFYEINDVNGIIGNFSDILVKSDNSTSKE